MSSNIFTIEGIIENGQIRLPGQLHLPEGARVFIIIPEMQMPEQSRIVSPRLAHPEQARDFELEVSVDSNHAKI